MSSRVISAVLTLKDKNFATGMSRANSQASDFGRGVSVVRNKVQDFERSATDAFKKVGKASMALGAAGISALGVSVAKTMLDMDSSFAKLQAQTGAMGDDFKALESAAKETFAKGYGESLDEVTEAVARVKQNMTGLDNGEISKVTSNAMLMASTFDSDVNEVTRGTSNLMQAFGISADKAFDLFTAGGQRGLNFSNEMFDNVAEYSSLFGKMGYSVEEYFGIMERGAQAGVYNLDYVNDVMKEFQIRVKDGSKSTDEAMSVMSKSTFDLWESFNRGEATVKDVASAVAKELQGMEDQVEANQLAVSLFGVKWEDLESDAMYAMLGTTDAMKDFEGATESAASKVEKSIKNRLVSSWRDLQLGIADVVSDGGAQDFLDTVATKAEELVPKVVDLVEKAFELGNTIKTHWTPIKETVLGITIAVAAFKLGMMAMSVVGTVTTLVKSYRAAVAAGTVAQWAMNGAMLANPLGLVVAGLAGAVAAGVLLYRNWDTVTAKTKEFWESIGGLEGALRIVTGPIGIVVGAAIDLAKNWDSTKSVWENVWGAMARSASDTVNSVIGGINTMIETINSIPGVNIPLVAKVDWGESEKRGASNVVAGVTKVDKSYGLDKKQSFGVDMVGKYGIVDVEGNYAVGANRLTKDHVAQVHKDEMIIPARQAQKVRAQGGTIDNIDSLIAKPNPNNVSDNSQSNKSIKDGITVIIQNLNAKGVTAKEVVDELVPQLKLAMANQ